MEGLVKYFRGIANSNEKSPNSLGFEDLGVSVDSFMSKRVDRFFFARNLQPPMVWDRCFNPLTM